MATLITPSRPNQTFEVIVGNIGTVHSGTSRKMAQNTHAEYVIQSKRGIGRAAYEAVTFMVDGEPRMEYAGTMPE